MSAPNLRIGAMISELYSPNLPRILDRAGYDFAIVDGEHGSFSAGMLGAMAATAYPLRDRFELLVRVSGIERGEITRLLDAGYNGVVVPMISTRSQACEVVQHTKYGPLGRRGVSTTRSHTNYGVLDFPNYQEVANVSILTLVQIETPEGLENVDEIAAVPGIDGLLVGPNDLRDGMRTVKWADPIERAVASVCHAAKVQGKLAGIITGDDALQNAALAAGATIVCAGSDLSLLMEAARSSISELRFRP